MAAGAYEIKLEQFEGPLDLLLHLVHKNEMDIQDIRIATITAQYLQHLELMKTRNMDIASEFLVMAATLLHLKSRTLLPPSRTETEDEDGQDPEEALKARLLEYQRYKEGAQKLEEYPRLFRDVFPRPRLEEGEKHSAHPLDAHINVSVYDLVRALNEVLRPKPQPAVHMVEGGVVSITRGVHLLLRHLRGKERVSFQRCFSAATTRIEVVVQFMALLEFARLQLLEVEQHAPGAMIYLYPVQSLRRGSYTDIEHMLDMENSYA
ncbi:MAG: segregation and condensation protein A, partial [Thermodesulfobacteriota bacterium]